MASLGGRYLNPHRTQFDGSRYAGSNCTPTSGANGANAATGGRVNKSGGGVRALVPRYLETDPRTPGWSIPDLVRAMKKIGVPFDNRSDQGWSSVISVLNSGHYVVVQGDSDRFSNATCSGAFNGNHAVGIHPASRVIKLRRQRWLNDPICKTGRWEYEYVLRNYAVKLAPKVHYGVFTTPVPKSYTAPAPAPTPAPTATQTLVSRVLWLRAHEPAAAKRWRSNHPTPANETAAQRLARLNREDAYLTAARVNRLVAMVTVLRSKYPVAAKAYRAKHPVPASETPRQREARLTAEVKALRSATH